MKGPGHDDDSKAEDRTATRYIDRVVLRAIDRRVVSRATDSLSDRPVLYKVAPREETLREARALLEAPPDLAPRLLDFGELDGTAAFLVTEWLDGPSLLRAPPAAERTVEVAASLASLVTRLHRANWVHSDLKPGNVVWADAACTSLRLIDFGFAFRADQGPEDEEGRGGSPGYAAPELTRGWRIDARVDQFALGVILSELFPALAADAECAAIFARMTALLPSARFADMVGATTALLQALERHEKVEADLKPRLGGGPLREREQLLASIGQALRAERSEEGALVLLHGAPGAGLSRLLLEIACVSQGVQVLEVETAWKNDTLEGRVLAQVKAALTKREPLVVGIADPSPELRTLGAAPTLRALLLERSSARVTIPRLSVEGFASVVAHALRDEPDDGRSAALHQSSDGDLHLAATLFADGAESMSKVAGAPRAPRWEAVPSDERVTLAIVDRCGAAPDFSIARRAVELLQGASAIDATIAAGWIHRDDRDRVAFTAESLRRAARELTLTDAARLDAWLLDNLIPDPDRPTELRESIDRASRLGRNEDEARILRCALDRAVTQGTHSRYLQLFEATGHHWTSEDVARHAARIASNLDAEWTLPRATHFLARALHRAGSPIGVVHLEEVGRGEGETALLARYEYLQALLNAGRREERTRVWAELESFLEAHAESYPGLIELEHARQARERGDQGDAITLAAKAEGRLAPWLPVYAVDAILLQASLAMPAAPDRATDLLRRALRQPMPTDTRVAVLMALAQVHELSGEFTRCADVAEEALVASSVLHSERHRHRILAQRAWSWALLDRAHDAEAEALALLRASEHRIESSRRATLHLLLGFVALHRGDVRSSYNAILTAWEATAGTASPMWRSVVLRSLADTCLDGEAWGIVPEAAAALGLGARERMSTPAEARWHGLLARAAGHHEESAAILRDARDRLDQSSDRIEVGRYLHHLAIAELGRGLPGARSAIEALDHALARFGEEGAGYFRAESLLARARANLLLEARDEALRDLDRSIELARRLHCRRTLASALRERTALLLRS